MADPDLESHPLRARADDLAAGSTVQTRRVWAAGCAAGSLSLIHQGWGVENVAEKPPLKSVSLDAAESLLGITSVDVAVYLPGTKGQTAVLYREEGCGLQKPDFNRLRQTGGRTILVHGEDLGKYETLLEDNLSNLLADASIPAEHKASCVHEVGTAVVRELISSEDTTESVERASSLLDTIMEGVLSQPSVAANLLCMSGHHQTTASHMFAVSTLAILLGAEIMGRDLKALREIGLAGMLHDLGKLQVDRAILNKQTPLTPEELRIIQHHPIESVRLIGSNPAITEHVKQMILQHHERYDGRGYPLGLGGDELLTGSKIISIVDSFHALIGRRAYRKGMSPVDAARVLMYQKGKQFDPNLYAVWMRLFQRCWQAQETINAYESEDEDGGHSFHSDHRQERNANTPRTQPRLLCRGRANVQCVHVGRLLDQDGGVKDEVLPLQDLSRGGLCMVTDRPMYRGEIVHVRMEAGGRQVWVRGLVSWCRRDISKASYKTGVKFLERISPDQVREPVPVRPVNDPRLFPISISFEPEDIPPTLK